MPALRNRKPSVPYFEMDSRSPSPNVHFDYSTPSSYNEDGQFVGRDALSAPANGRLFEAPSDEPIKLSKRVQNANKKKGPDYVPRSQNCFMIFRNDFIKRRYVPTEGLDNQTISKIISNAWQAMPNEEKDQWRQKAREAKFEHSLMYPEYRYRPVHKPRKKKTGEKPPPKVKKGRKGKPLSPRDQARTEDQAEAATAFLMAGYQGAALSAKMKEWDADWDERNPAELFPETHPQPAAGPSTKTLPYPVQPEEHVEEASSLPPPSHLLYPPQPAAQSSSPVEQEPILAPVPSPAFRPNWMGHRRSMSQPHESFPVHQAPLHFLHEEPAPQTSYGGFDERSWLGHRRSSSVGAIQYMNLPSNSRRPSAANILYPPQAFQHGHESFMNPAAHLAPLQYPPPHEWSGSQDSHGESMFNPAFSFDSSHSFHQEKPRLPELMLGPHDSIVYPYDQMSNLSVSPNSSQWAQYTPGGDSGNGQLSGPPSTIFGTPSPESLGHSVVLPAFSTIEGSGDVDHLHGGYAANDWAISGGAPHLDTAATPAASEVEMDMNAGGPSEHPSPNDYSSEYIDFNTVHNDDASSLGLYDNEGYALDASL